MSWFVSTPVEDGNTQKLEEAFQNQVSSPSEEVQAQFDFVLATIEEAFEAEVVAGNYTISTGGHDDPSYDTNRKSLNITFTPTLTEVATAAAPATETDSALPVEQPVTAPSTTLPVDGADT